MRYAVNLPNLGALADPGSAVRVAVAAEEAGWDEVFVWDHILGWDGAEVGDAWVILAAMAQATSEIRLGPMVTPLPRRRPWELARQAVSLDQLSNGRLTSTRLSRNLDCGQPLASGRPSGGFVDVW